MTERVVSIERSLPAQRQTDRHLTETGSVSTSAPARRAESGRARACDQVKSAIHVISEELFRGALIRERKSADRSNQQFGVLLLNLEGQATVDSAVWDQAIEALGVAKRETDVLGWFEHRVSLGLILPEIGVSGAGAAQDVEVRVRRELFRRLEASEAARFSIKLHIHQERPADGLGSVEPLIERLRPASELRDAVRQIQAGTRRRWQREPASCPVAGLPRDRRAREADVPRTGVLQAASHW